MISHFVNGGFFYIGFFIAIIGATSGAFWWGPLFFLVMLTIHLFFYGHPRHEFLFVMIVCIIGIAAESLLIRNQIITYPGTRNFLPPLWLVSIYGMYAMTVDHSLKWFRHHKFLTIPLGAISAAFSYLAGARLGAATFLVPTTELLIAISLLWGILAPASFVLREWVGSEK